MKLAIVLSTCEPETMFNGFRIGSFALAAGDSVSVFLMGAGVEIASVCVPSFNVPEKAMAFQHEGGEILACGTCLDARGLGESPLYLVSNLKALHDLVRASDKVLTF